MGSLILNDQGELQETRGAAIESIPRGMGRGGTVTVLARDVIFVSGRDSRGSPSGLFSNTSSRGDARRITISAPSVRLEDGDIITGRALSEGRGGDIALEVGTLTLTGGARIDSGATGAGSGGW
jgi:hypothetical protein